MNLGRCSGILLHLTSIPSLWGVGDLGPSSYGFVDLLAEGRQSIWQVLPLTPVGDHGSPYSARSLFAGNPLLLSPERLFDEGFLGDLPEPVQSQDPARVDYGASLGFKDLLVEAAYRHSFEKTRGEREYSDFCEQNSSWLDDFAVYEALSKKFGRPLVVWPEEVRRREAGAVEGEASGLRAQVDRSRFAQYLFRLQWSALKRYAGTKGVKILGDVPFYVLHDSADIWARPDLFKVGEGGEARFVGGVPPDYFSKTGQRWGNPVYDWGRIESEGYRWWVDRVSRSLDLSDYLRLDHFRGYVAYWEVPASSATAEQGEWIPVPRTFLEAVKKAFPELPFVAEDLGVITDDVREAIHRLGIPGMRVLQFGFDGSTDNPHFPPNHPKNSYVCTGTHDTNTSRGWYSNEATPRERGSLETYVGHSVDEDSICGEFLDMAMSSASDLCVIPLQDLLGLGPESRMNNPATSEGNWRWRALPGELSAQLFRKLGETTAAHGR